jgi:DNA polymerase-3 subunit alpha
MFTSLTDAVDTIPELSTMIAQDPDAERLVTIAKKLEGVARHTSTHACAVVITRHPLTKHVPLQYADAESKAVITQYSMKPIESLGLLKMDFLGLKNLTIIEDALKLISASTSIDVDLESIPLDDADTFKLLQAANTVGVFQLESSGMRRYLKQLQPTEFEDIIAMVSLYRPGPMEFIPDYIDGKHGKREITYLDERLKPVLGRTYGIAVYQEQVSEIARQLAGFSYGQADTLRKAVAKKNKALLDEQGKKLIAGMVEHGISKSTAQKIWDFILPFARYGFNRSHAACYAMIAYRTAYLKAHYPSHFMAALLTSDHGDTERVAIEVHHAEQLGIRVLPPDVNFSRSSFTVVQRVDGTEGVPDIRFGLAAIKNVGAHIIDVIIAERDANGPFKTLEEFLSRVRDKDLNKKSLESLIKVGALDAFGERNQLLMNMELLLQYTKRHQEEASSGQFNLFGALRADQKPRLTLSPAPEVPSRTILNWEKELLGLFISGHPLEPYREVLKHISIPFEELKEYTGHVVNLTGIVTSLKRISTKNGEPMLFVGFADHTGEIEAIVFPKTLKNTMHVWQEDVLLQITGKLDDKDGAVKLLVEEAKSFKPENLKLYILLPEQVKKTVFENVKQILLDNPGDVPVVIVSGDSQRDTNKTVNVSCMQNIAEILGQEDVRVV